MPIEQTANPMVQLFPFIAIALIFYFLVIRPEKGKQKEHRDKLAGLKRNDEVITSSGIHGTIVNIKETTVIVRVDDNVKMEFDKDAIATIKNKAAAS